MIVTPRSYCLQILLLLSNTARPDTLTFEQSIRARNEVGPKLASRNNMISTLGTEVQIEPAKVLSEDSPGT